jgi:hypothetical protein
MEIQISNGGGTRQSGLNRENDDDDYDDDDVKLLFCIIA